MQQLRPAKARGAIDVETAVEVDRDRDVIFLPMLVLLPGAGSFGEAKQQGLFPGLEYLDNEPSSSEADVTGPAHNRQVPDSLKITMPLMVIAARDRYVGLVWKKEPQFCAVFDSPDRIFHAGGHLMGVLFPGSNGANREEDSLLPYDGAVLQANQPIELQATIIGGEGRSVIPAVQQYVAMEGLPPLPDSGTDLQGYTALASAGWLDSAIRNGATYQHAYPGSFKPYPVSDAAMWMRWLSQETTNSDLRRQLEDQSAAAEALVTPGNENYAAVGHITYPVESLIFGHVLENARRARENARQILTRFEPDGSVYYHAPADGLDLGKTHFARDANGLTAQVVADLLQQASVCGDRDLIQQGIRMLRALDKFENTVPRGAQTWEVPLHTPDILASAWLVRAYTLGYQLTSETHFLDEAKYWAWTGVPFVYLVNPTTKPVGLYATIPVLGATHWVAPVWMGLPVQWCGLVYSDAIARLAPFDPSGPWQMLSRGIAISGIQQTWPIGKDPKRQGLLPDSYQLRAQTQNDPAINPGTVQANAVRLYSDTRIYSFHAFRSSGVILHAPGALSDVKDSADAIQFAVHPWVHGAYWLLLSGWRTTNPHIRVNGRPVDLGASETLPSAECSAADGLLALHLQGDCRIEADLP